MNEIASLAGGSRGVEWSEADCGGSSVGTGGISPSEGRSGGGFSVSNRWRGLGGAARTKFSSRLAWLLGMGAGLVGLIAVVRLWVGVTMVSGTSMEPMLQTGDLLWIDRRAYRKASPARGDVVVAWYRGEWIVKRVVGLPGDEVEVRDGELFIHGVRTTEPQEVLPGPLTIQPGRMGQGRYALLGDNRSELARTFVHAVVPESALMGRVTTWWRLGGVMDPFARGEDNGWRVRLRSTKDTSASVDGVSGLRRG